MGYSWVTPDEEPKNGVVNQNSEAMTWALQKKPYKGYVPWLVAVVVILVWWLISALHWVSSTALPSPGSVFHDFISVATIGYSGVPLLTSTLYSLGRITAGFLAAVVVGIPLGFWMASSDWVFLAIDPLLQFLRPIPPLAYIPVMIVWFGIGETSKVILIFFCTIPIIIISAMSGVKSAQETRIRAAQCLGANKRQLFRYVILPSALPEIFTGMRVGIGIAWTCLVAAEMIAASKGLGWMIEAAGNELQIGVVFVGIVIIGLLGYGMELVIRRIEHRVTPWKGKA
ncbi:ABC transporter permease [Sulfobacillus thermosulfidooxidans]|uniref:ABC transporter permease n=1 Tax=Sulfobacillus thermosulfidooxidans TaxID=28034 RepID=UPI00096B9DAB|nr:ABC transporter permease [Sulfobacillus thermosulfidooxidans]OLZ11743.1 taurine transporter subunit [Sulfobacillus thermosulfidooxidans]OLZ18706.1 taurine transporter subunit [Sulfobacillus thermosulfidooxidans]OLZ20215.1 taurine transporter subunit [Sulfobacillus thermosulfidooxidans]